MLFFPEYLFSEQTIRETHVLLLKQANDIIENKHKDALTKVITYTSFIILVNICDSCAQNCHFGCKLSDLWPEISFTAAHPMNNVAA